jgi:hypothetical protein
MTKPSRKCRRPADNGVPNLESITEVKRLQKDMLDRLQRSTQDPISYVGLAYCSPKHCGRTGCSEACWYGTCRRLQSELQTIYNLLEKTDQPLYEVRVIPGTWAKVIGELDQFDIAAVKRLNSRALNKLHKPSLIAVGNVKVAIALTTHYKYGDRLWACELHEIVTVAEEAELKAAFSRLREGGAFLNKIWVKKVEDLGECINRVFRRDLRPWGQPGLQPWQTEPEPVRPTKAEQTEFYRWLLGLSLGARTIRYGCDQYLNKLTKQPRTIRAPKKRRYPYHLKPYMFGYDPDDDPEVSRRMGPAGPHNG